ncbi:Cytochrome c oxidase subunit 6B [Exophiala dermatitidis]|uniref:Cytochrome c oxidase subunit 6B n=1 Tax=Exophiala dermatitidis TaxID=5970 RepID=A0AAN6J2B2_EXODE|nr:Cytochrome c oxidase subunit 6B [Exophiala dermatitidis]KAJ4524488.1 Cytochrome c oxidase subunit 6B [Exophiala dermatitidis]KAJ4527335.1 Cytochrome c oxidase subunit 6B [Exophiala dermatitidis]KAJ4530891.1 Cytochrome c oxidase subunit 6B [Exophiala dermatitidis]KAJ4549798.1 Cytochrome c oxidase subunit 6B [Exophiala dermatitidis]
MVEIEIPDAEELGGNVTKPFKFVTAGYDARFPNQNQTKHCWQNYVDYHKCILAKGEDFKPCRQVYRHLWVEKEEFNADTIQFYLAYRSLCPSSWIARWDDQREAGNFPVDLEH